VPASAALRAAAISIVCCVLLSPSARANPAITRADDLTPFALAGSEVLVARTEDRELRLLSYPVAGGPGVERFRFTAPLGRNPNLRIAASSEAVGMVLATDEGHGDLINAQPYAGARGDALSPLGPPVRRARTGFFPIDFTAAGGRVVLREFREAPRDMRFSVYESGGAPVVVRLPRGARAVDFAGELVAYVVWAPGRPRVDLAEQVVVREWRTGIVHWTAVFNDGVGGLDLRADGAVVVEDSGEIVSVGPGGSPMLRISRAGSRPVFVSDGIVFVRGVERKSPMRLVLARPGQPLRTFGPPTARIGELVADGGHVAWEQNGCLLVADIADPPGPVLPPGPCPRSELRLVNSHATVPLGPDRVLPVRLQCLAAAPPGCRGSVSLDAFGPHAGPLAGRVRFTIRVGATRRFRIRLTKSGYAALVREDAKHGDAGVVVAATTTDQALVDAYSIKLR
jgi:hypothetical protein